MHCTCVYRRCTQRRLPLPTYWVRTRSHSPTKEEDASSAPLSPKGDALPSLPLCTAHTHTHTHTQCEIPARPQQPRRPPAVINFLWKQKAPGLEAEWKGKEDKARSVLLRSKTATWGKDLLMLLLLLLLVSAAPAAAAAGRENIGKDIRFPPASLSPGQYSALIALSICKTTVVLRSSTV